MRRLQARRIQPVITLPDETDTQIGMPLEEDTVQIPNFSLVPDLRLITFTSAMG